MRGTRYLVGQVIKDLNSHPLDPRYFSAQLEPQAPVFYKEGGYFVFPNLRPGSYSLKLNSFGFVERHLAITMGHEPQMLRQPGQNEFLVFGKIVCEGNRHLLTFSRKKLTRSIFAGATVFGPNYHGVLAESLHPGDVMRVFVSPRTTEQVPSTQSVFRIIREWSIRMRYASFHRFEQPMTSLVGRMLTPAGNPVSNQFLEITGFDEQAFEWVMVQDLAIAVFRNNQSETNIIGTKEDLITQTDRQGRFHFYFDPSFNLESLSLKRDDQTLIVPLVPGIRNDFEFVREASQALPTKKNSLSAITHKGNRVFTD